MPRRRPSPLERRLLIDGPALLERKLAHLADAQASVWHTGRDLVLAGHSYAALGRMLGVSPQAARQRFGPHVDAWRDEHGDVMPWDLGDGPDFDGYDEIGPELDLSALDFGAVDQADVGEDDGRRG